MFGRGTDVTKGADDMDRFEWVRSKVFGRIVDIGCNKGDVFNGTPFAPNVMGVDLDTWTPAYGLGFKQADAHELPFKDGEFHCAVCGEILEHVKDPVKVLKEAKRVANGCIIISVPYEFNWDKSLRPMMPIDERLKLDNLKYEDLAKKETLDQPGCTGAVDDKTNPHLWHIRWYTLDTLTEDIEKAGLKYKIELLQYGGWSFFMGILK